LENGLKKKVKNYNLQAKLIGIFTLKMTEVKRVFFKVLNYFDKVIDGDCYENGVQRFRFDFRKLRVDVQIADSEFGQSRILLELDSVHSDSDDSSEFEVIRQMGNPATAQVE
jgi:hypothetical protein